MFCGLFVYAYPDYHAITTCFEYRVYYCVSLFCVRETDSFFVSLRGMCQWDLHIIGKAAAAPLKEGDLNVSDKECDTCT